MLRLEFRSVWRKFLFVTYQDYTRRPLSRFKSDLRQSIRVSVPAGGSGNPSAHLNMSQGGLRCGSHDGAIAWSILIKYTLHGRVINVTETDAVIERLVVREFIFGRLSDRDRVGVGWGGTAILVKTARQSSTADSKSVRQIGTVSG